MKRLLTLALAALMIAGCALSFGLELIRALKGDEAAAAIEKQIVIR